MPTERPAVAAVVLAAGLGTRFAAGDGSSKMLALLDGVPLVRRAATAALGSRARPVLVVTGHEASRVEAALAELDVALVANPDFASGLASSLRAGIAALPASAAAALVFLGDMPRVTSALADRLVEAFEAEPDRDAVVPVFGAQRGNPVLLSRRLFPEIARLEGDEGARKLLARSERIVEIAIDDPGVALDIDTREALDALGKAGR
jgi:molybdenum cofactor cytidylyltransferase